MGLDIHQGIRYLHVHAMYTHAKKRKAPVRLRHKHLKLDQTKIDFAKKYFAVDSEQEAIDRALSLLLEEEQFTAKLKPLGGILKGDRRPWPYT